jgi:hypothetical protein
VGLCRGRSGTWLAERAVPRIADVDGRILLEREDLGFRAARELFSEEKSGRIRKGGSMSAAKLALLSYATWFDFDLGRLASFTKPKFVLCQLSQSPERVRRPHPKTKLNV